MENFNFCVGVNVLFGKDQVEHLPSLLEPYGKKVLLCYGGGSIKKIGLYDKVQELLRDYEVHELSGIAPNPKIDSVREGVRLCREHGIEVILPVGGGSVIDCAKAIAAAVYDDGDAWDMIALQKPIERALPIVTVLTLAATGSEADNGAVISNPETNEKLGLGAPALMPRASIMDPTDTFTVPAHQTAAGCADIMSHLMEQYFVPASSYMGDLLVESVMKTIIKYAPVAIKEPDNYEARAQIMWGSSIGDNATLCNGNMLAVFGVHGMEHELSAHYDLTHGVGLAILTPAWMKHVMKKAPEIVVPRFAHFAKAVWGLDGGEDAVLAEKAIEATEQFFRELNLPGTLTEVGIDASKFAEMAEHAERTGGLEYAWIPLTAEDVAAVFELCL